MNVTRSLAVADDANLEPAARLAALDAESLETALDRDGCALVPHLLDPAECARIAALYETSSASARGSS